MCNIHRCILTHLLSIIDGWEACHTLQCGGKEILVLCARKLCKRFITLTIKLELIMSFKLQLVMHLFIKKNKTNN